MCRPVTIPNISNVIIQIRMWYCGDDVCGCSQVHVEWVGPNQVAGGDAKSVGEIDAGTFVTDHERIPDGELKALAEKYDIPLNEDDYYGERPANVEEVELCRLYGESHKVFANNPATSNRLLPASQQIRYNDAIEKYRKGKS